MSSVPPLHGASRNSEGAAFGTRRRGRPPGSAWTAERIEQARGMWLSGASAGMIGEALGASRNAVLGKLGRLGVLRSAELADQAARSRAAAEAEAEAPLLRRRRRRGPVVELTATTDLMGLPDRACRWPIGEPDRAGFGFCGRGVVGRRSYCEVHHRRAHLSGPLEPIEEVAGLRPKRRADPSRPRVFEGWGGR